LPQQLSLRGLHLIFTGEDSLTEDEEDEQFNPEDYPDEEL